MCTRITQRTSQNRECWSPRISESGLGWSLKSAFQMCFWMLLQLLGWDHTLRTTSLYDTAPQINCTQWTHQLLKASCAWPWTCLQVFGHPVSLAGKFSGAILTSKAELIWALGISLVLSQHEFTYHFAFPWWQEQSHSSLFSTWHIAGGLPWWLRG